ncbi:MAG TPA: hypothetical protein VHF89_04040 [Solirubrobacteraceae bacterium]|nr:hypothetical protein [Solirubrobacteraceae bacterium]
MRRLASLALIAAAAAVAAPAARADVATFHSDPHTTLPDALVVQPVEQGEMGRPSRGTALRRTHQLPETWCGSPTTVDDTANAVYAQNAAQLKLVYAYASDQPNRFDQLDDRLQANVSLLSRYLAGQSGGEKTLRWDMGTSCGPQYADIQVVQLPKTRAEYVPGGAPSFLAVAGDVEAIVEPQQDGPRNWVVYADGLYGTNGVAGAAWRIHDDDPAGAPHNAGRLESVTFGPQTLPSNGYAWPSVMLHEITHNLGAVQNAAPHSTGKGHCNDRYDVMCYPDGGPSSAPFERCPIIAGDVTETFDCGGDTYFNPSPPAGSYLAERWNVFNSAHLGSCAELAAGCAATTNTTPAAPVAWRSSSYGVTLSGDDAGTPADAWQWQVDGGAVQATQTATVAGDGVHTLRTRVRAGAANWSPWRSETVRIDLTPPTVSVACSALGDGRHSCVADAADGGSGVAELVALRDGAAGAAQDGAAFVVDGPARVAARATDAVGHTATTAEVELAAPPPRVEPRTTTTTTTLPPQIVPPDDGIVPLPPVRAALRDARGRRLGTGVLEVAGGRATARLTPRRLRAGTWRLRICLGGRCATKTVRLRRAGTPSALRATFPAAGAASFSLARRARGRFRTVARAALPVPAVDR